MKDVLPEVDAWRSAGNQVAIATVVRGGQVGAKLLILPQETLGGLGDAELDAAVQADAPDLLVRERSETRPYRVAGHEEPVEVFIETFPPRPTLLIFGAVHVAQPLSRFAKALGFDVIVSDARAKLATTERFPDADRIIQGWPDETLEQVEILPNTYVAILSHDPKFDEPALLGTLSTPAAYIGAIGSRSSAVIAGIVLAAGRSARLGRPKQLLPVHGEPLIRHTLGRVLASSLDQVILVVGHEADLVRDAVAGLPVECVFNPDSAAGQSTSVRAGLAALSSEVEAAVFILGDQPGVAPNVIDDLIAAWRTSSAPVVVPRYEDRMGNPVLFDRRVFPE